MTDSAVHVTLLGDSISSLTTWYKQILSKEDLDLEFIYRSKARFRGRLQDRWTCKTPGHVYCFANDGVHVPIRENAMEAWVAALVRNKCLCDQDMHLSSFSIMAMRRC